MSSGPKTTQQSVTAPPAWMDPYWKSLFGDTAKAQASVDRTPYTGRVVAGANGADAAASDATGRILAGMGVAPGTFTRNATDAASGKFLDPATNPTLKGTVDAATQPILENLMRSILPGIKAQQVGMNAFGADRSRLREGQAIGDSTEAALRISNEIFGQNYDKERAIQLAAPQLFQQGAAAELAQGQGYAAEADRQRDVEGLDIQNSLGLRQLNSMLPFLGLDQAAGIFGASPYSTTSTTSQTKDPSQVWKALLGLAATAGGFALGGPAGAAAGASLGGLGSSMARKAA